jgi:hypothetical protein
MTATETEAAFYGPVIDRYTRAAAITDGTLIEADPELCRDAGIVFPVAFSPDAYADCVAWTEEDARRGPADQDAEGRLWDVLVTFAAHARCNRPSVRDAMSFPVSRVPRGGFRHPRAVRLRAQIHPGDQGEPVITITLPRER